MSDFLLSLLFFPTIEIFLFLCYNIFMKNYKFILPKKVNTILNTLVDAGFEAYIVGGCVRDLILEIEPNDYDITTDAVPEQIKELFEKTIDTGIEHGTVSVLIDKEIFEITTFRIDGDYLDSRHPESVTYTRNLSEDLLRRDFTINAMAYYDEVIDIFDGLTDLEKGIIRGVGDPDARFKEDALRMLRAIRFSSRFAYEIEPKTKKAIADNCHLIANVSVERIKIEIDKTLLSINPDYFEQIYSLGLLIFINEPLNHIFSEEENRREILELLKEIKAELFLKWTILLDRMEIRQAVKALKALKFDNNTSKKIISLLGNKDEHVLADGVQVRKHISKMGELYPYFLEYKRAYASIKSDKEGLEEIELAGKIYKETLDLGYACSISELAINGNDVMTLGYKGKKVGEVLAFVLSRVLEKPSLNKREVLIELAKKY